MFRLYLITAWRNLKKNRVVSIINITGLTVGLSCSIFAIYYSVNELVADLDDSFVATGILMNLFTLIIIINAMN